MARTPEGVRLYNSLQIQTHVDPDDVRLLIDYLCRETVQVEQWLPKASLAGRMYDLRIVVIAGRARQVVVRTSAQPMTNLHLGNRRGDLPALQARVGPARWADILATAERAAAAFGDSLYMGVDVLVLPGYRESRVLEVNAFGDLLPRVESQGQDTYESEIAACLAPERESGSRTVL